MPYVGVDLPVYVFQFIQLIYLIAAVPHLDPAHLVKRHRFEEPQRRRPVAQNQVLPVLRQPPPFAVVV